MKSEVWIPSLQKYINFVQNYLNLVSKMNLNYQF